MFSSSHGGFCWGKNAEESYLNFQRLEFIAELASKHKLKKIKVSDILKNKHFLETWITYYGNNIQLDKFYNDYISKLSEKLIDINIGNLDKIIGFDSKKLKQ